MVAELLWLELVWIVDWWAGVKVWILSYFMLFRWYLSPIVDRYIVHLLIHQFMVFACYNQFFDVKFKAVYRNKM